MTDSQGNIIAVVSNSGEIVQRTNYYPSGEPWLEPDYNSENVENRYLYAGKERETGGGINEYDFVSRNYVASFPRFTTIDPEAERSPWLSPYLYCNGNPVNNSDPDGKHTRVKLFYDNFYEVIGGKLDGDLNVYVYTQDDSGAFTVRGESIGQTPTETSFYNSDLETKKNVEKPEYWRVGSTIDMNDMSGQVFLSNLMVYTPTLIDYMKQARNSHPFDFKCTNGTLDAIEGIDFYRGMPIQFHHSEPPYIASARDIGNIVAGYVAAAKGLPYVVARIGFDGYQFITNFRTEGRSTTNAEQFGYNLYTK